MDLGSHYLLIALRLRRLEPGLVESYTGPPELAERVEREPAPSANELDAEVTELRRLVEVGELDPDRRAWLDGQLAGIATALARLAGSRLGYRELFERCHGAEAELVPDEQFQRAHDLLDGTLPGRGEVRERYLRWSETQAVPRERLLEGLDALTFELRRRTDERFGLPAGEEARFELATGWLRPLGIPYDARTAAVVRARRTNRVIPRGCRSAAAIPAAIPPAFVSSSPGS